MLLSACGRMEPGAEDLRTAYAAHLLGDLGYEHGSWARHFPQVEPNQRPDCTGDGIGHFDCRVRVTFDGPAGRQSTEQLLHVRREGAVWVVDAVG